MPATTEQVRQAKRLIVVLETAGLSMTEIAWRDPADRGPQNPSQNRPIPGGFDRHEWAGQRVKELLDYSDRGLIYSSECLTKGSTWIGPSRHWLTRAGAAWLNDWHWDLPRSAN